ncbi:MAG TPA: ROK family transcriptional regulator [Flexivirga sp.]|uniref:ROK family transcriptional regulator n=1 Tax=Flexivirga sp. TaxID=1962927 RepID=UPI002C6E6978|nr:ROK family transcriptional regulator [Flexivirga sp.]HWC23904.1 ROK family transcriptional regulator [Flexivirga sp.]
MQKDTESQRSGPSAVPSAMLKVLGMIGTGEATSRASIARFTGLARSTVSQQVDVLIARGVVEETEINGSVRGRPPRRLSISRDAGAIVTIDVDVMATQVSIADLGANLVAQDIVRATVDAGADELLDAVIAAADSLLRKHHWDRSRVRHVVVGLPAPVDFHRRTAVRPPIMPGWDGYPVGDHLQDAFGCPVLVDNDVNLMALGEAVQEDTDTPLLFVKVGAGIGAGIITDAGTIHRGADGSAGDIGHIQVRTRRDTVCSCGKLDCLEAVASYRAVLADLKIERSDTEDPLHASRELAQRVTRSDSSALFRIRQAATDLGEVVATLIHTLNPRTLVLGGPLSELHDEVLSGVRAAVYARALPLATRKLVITTSQLGAGAGTAGAVALARQECFSAEGVARLLAASRT